MKIRASKITTKDLIRESLLIPQGWHEEVYIARGFVKFSSAMTANSWSQDQSNVVGRIESLNFSDVQGMCEREDERIEIDINALSEYDSRTVIKGECYEQAQIISKKEAIELITYIADEEEWDISKLAQQIQDVSKLVNEERISYIKAIAKMEEIEA